jgi:hypothetical protein
LAIVGQRLGQIEKAIVLDGRPFLYGKNLLGRGASLFFIDLMRSRKLSSYEAI